MIDQTGAFILAWVPDGERYSIQARARVSEETVLRNDPEQLREIAELIVSDLLEAIRRKAEESE